MDKKALERTAGSNVEFSCPTSGGAAQRGALGPFGVLFLADDSLSENTPVYFYVAKESDGSLNTHFCTDQSRYIYFCVLITQLLAVKVKLWLSISHRNSLKYL